MGINRELYTVTDFLSHVPTTEEIINLYKGAAGRKDNELLFTGTKYELMHSKYKDSSLISFSMSYSKNMGLKLFIQDDGDDHE